MPPVYKFALYGLRASGKTCLLTALAVPRIANPRRYTGTWIDKAPGGPTPQNSSAPPGDDPFQRGRLHLLEQIALFKNGGIPEATSNKEAPMSLLFDFTDPERGVFRVEIADYSGELVALNTGELAARLREHMNERDGLLILAEVPEQQGKAAALAAEFECLKTAFLQLRDGQTPETRRDWSVAILLNKWDRRGPIDFANPDGERRKMEEFLEGSPDLPHRVLINAVEGVVSKENLRISPVSAFGASEKDDGGKELPRMDGLMLRSFGLEDPFVDLANRRDELDAKHYQEAVLNCSSWRFTDLLIGRRPAAKANSPDTVMGHLRGPSPWRCLADGLKLRKRLPGDSPARPQVAKGLRAAWWKLGGQFLSGFAVVAFLALSGEAIVDGVRYRRIGINQSNPKLAAETAREDEKWLETYATSSRFRHLVAKASFLPSISASERLKALRSQRDEVAWNGVNQAEDPRIKATHAEEYLKDFPQGSHAAEAAALVDAKKKYENLDHLEKIQTELKKLTGNDAPAEKAALALLGRVDALPNPSFVDGAIKQAQQSTRGLVQVRLAAITAAITAEKSTENIDYILKLKSELDGLTGNDSEAEKAARGLLDRLNDLPHPTAIDDKVNGEKVALRDRVFNRMKEMGVTRDDAQWAEFRGQILELLRRKLVVEAAAQLNKRVPKEPRLKELGDDFAEQCAPIVSQEVESNLKSGMFSEARKIWKGARDDKDIANLLSKEQLETLEALGPRIDEAEDRAMYEQLRRNQGRSARSYADQYLDAVPSGRMRKEVSEYKAHLDRMDGPLDLKLTLAEIAWGEGAADGYQHEVNVNVDGKPVIDETVEAHPLKRTGQIGKEIGILKKGDEEIRIVVKVVQKAWWYLTSDNGAGEGNAVVRVDSLKNGKTVVLLGTGQTHKALFKVTGFPAEPPLPAWGAN